MRPKMYLFWKPDRGRSLVASQDIFIGVWSVVVEWSLVRKANSDRVIKGEEGVRR